MAPSADTFNSEDPRGDTGTFVILGESQTVPSDINNDGDITGDEIRPWGQDECVLFEVILIPGKEGVFAPGTYTGGYANDYWNPGPRGVAVDYDGAGCDDRPGQLGDRRPAAEADDEEERGGEAEPGMAADRAAGTHALFGLHDATPRSSTTFRGVTAEAGRAGTGRSTATASSVWRASARARRWSP